MTLAAKLDLLRLSYRWGSTIDRIDLSGVCVDKLQTQGELADHILLSAAECTSLPLESVARRCVSLKVEAQHDLTIDLSEFRLLETLQLDSDGTVRFVGEQHHPLDRLVVGPSVDVIQLPQARWHQVYHRHLQVLRPEIQQLHMDCLRKALDLDLLPSLRTLRIDDIRAPLLSKTRRSLWLEIARKWIMSARGLVHLSDEYLAKPSVQGLFECCSSVEVLTWPLPADLDLGTMRARHLRLCDSRILFDESMLPQFRTIEMLLDEFERLAITEQLGAEPSDINCSVDEFSGCPCVSFSRDRLPIVADLLCT